MSYGALTREYDMVLFKDLKNKMEEKLGIHHRRHFTFTCYIGTYMYVTNEDMQDAIKFIIKPVVNI
jgi:hypothetical protein